MVKSCYNLLADSEYAWASVINPLGTIPLSAMIASCGYVRVTRRNYDLHGLKRGSAPFCVFQYCTSGWGMLRYETPRGEKEYRVDPGQAILLTIPYNNRYWIPRESPHWEFVYLCILAFSA